MRKIQLTLIFSSLSCMQILSISSASTPSASEIPASKITIINNTDDNIQIYFKVLSIIENSFRGIFYSGPYPIGAHSQNSYSSDVLTLQIKIQSPSKVIQEIEAPLYTHPVYNKKKKLWWTSENQKKWWWTLTITKNTDPQTKTKEPYILQAK